MRLKEFSKRLTIYSMVLFFSQVFGGMIFCWADKNMELFVYTIPATGVAFTTCLAFYFNKAKHENISKGWLHVIDKKALLLGKEEALSEVNTMDSVYQNAETSELAKVAEKDYEEDIIR